MFFEFFGDLGLEDLVHVLQDECADVLEILVIREHFIVQLDQTFGIDETTLIFHFYITGVNEFFVLIVSSGHFKETTIFIEKSELFYQGDF